MPKMITQEWFLLLGRMEQSSADRCTEREIERSRDREIVELSESKMEEAAKETDREREEDEEEMISD